MASGCDFGYLDRQVMIRIKRTYEAPARADGRRVLVERLWPRGMKKEDLAPDAWIKDVAPSTELRKWFGHRVERWEQFRQRYRAELVERPADSRRASRPAGPLDQRHVHAARAARRARRQGHVHARGGGGVFSVARRRPQRTSGRRRPLRRCDLASRELRQGCEPSDLPDHGAAQRPIAGAHCARCRPLAAATRDAARRVRR